MNDESGEDSVQGDDSEDSHALWIDALERVMSEEKIFLQSDITSADLARMIGTNRTYLSDYLNNALHITFYDYINGFRMDAVDELLKDKTLSMTEIAERCGFSDIRTFRRLFQNKYGCLPSQYKR